MLPAPAEHPDTAAKSSNVSGLSIQVLRTTAELEAFLPEWTELWQQDSRRTPFQHPSWLLPWWHSFPQPELRCLVLGRERNLQAFLPFYLYPEPIHNDEGSQTANQVQLETSEGTVPRVPQEHGINRKLLLVGAGTSDYLDGLFAPTCTVNEVVSALQVLLQEGGFDTLDVMQIRPESLLAKALQELGANGSNAEPTSVMPAVPLSGLPTKIRRNAMYYRKRAERDATLVLTFATAENCGEEFDTLVRLHAARWQERGEAGVLDDPAVLAWHREALPQLAQAGLLRLAALTRNGEPLGLMYALADDDTRVNRTLYLYLPAFSLEHRDFRPGTVLLALLIDAAAREGFTTIDMLRGGEGYKQLWHVEQRGTLALTLTLRQS